MEKTISVERLRALFQYDPVSGVIHSQQRRLDNWKDSDGYRRVSFWISGHRKSYMAHRLAWLAVHGEWPSGDIDHINGIRDDNRFENLRDVDRRTNAQNQRKATAQNTTSGMLGVSFEKDRKKWAAHITINGKNLRIGRFDTAEQAKAAYLKAKRQHHAGCTI